MTSRVQDDGARTLEMAAVMEDCQKSIGFIKVNWLYLIVALDLSRSSRFSGSFCTVKTTCIGDDSNSQMEWNDTHTYKHIHTTQTAAIAASTRDC